MGDPNLMMIMIKKSLTLEVTIALSPTSRDGRRLVLTTVTVTAEVILRILLLNSAVRLLVLLLELWLVKLASGSIIF